MLVSKLMEYNVMQKKILISLGLIAMIGFTTVQAMANSTIYTDELGRMHFLGKDPEAKTLQKVEDYSNPEEKDVTNASYGLRNIDRYDAERYYNVNETKVKSSTPDAEGKSNKSKATYTSTKGAMDASNPYEYGGTNVKPKDPLDLNDGNTGKRFWQIW